MAAPPPDRDPAHTDADPKPSDTPSPLGPVEPLDTFDDGLVVGDDGVGGPPGVAPPAGEDEDEDEGIPLGELPPEDPLAGSASFVRRTLGQPADPADAVGGPTAAPPAGPASGWLESVTKLPKSSPPVPGGSAADIDLPPLGRPGEEPSDIFSTARRPTGSDLFGSGTSLPPGSVVRADDPSRVGGYGGGESDLFTGVPGMVAGRGSSMFDSPSKATDKVKPRDDEPPADEEFERTEPNIDLDSGDAHGSVFERELPKGESDSDLFGDHTVADLDLLGNGPSGVNILDPEAEATQDSGHLSSIFGKGVTGNQPSDGGRVDLDRIPHQGYGADRTEAMLPPEDSNDGIHFAQDSGRFGKGPGTKVSFELPEERGSQDALMDYQDSARIEWTGAAAGGDGDDLFDNTMAVRPTADDDLTADLDADALGSQSSGRHNRPVDDESVFAMPAVAGSGLSDRGLSALLDDAASEAARSVPSSSRGISLASSTRTPPAVPHREVRPAAVPGSARRSSSPMTPATTPAAPKAKGGRLLAGALGVLAGTAVGAAGVYFGTSPTGMTKQVVGPIAERPAAERPAPAVIAADPEAALARLEAAGEAPEVKAGRGQARWLTRVRAAADGGPELKADDAELAKARTDLRGVLDMGSDLKTPAEQQAGLRAALHLGLTYEAVGDPDGAVKVYQEAKAKLPFKPVFDSAIERVAAMRKTADGLPVRQYTLAAPAAEDLAGAVQLLDFPPVQEGLNVEAEPAFHFWKAVQFAADWSNPGAFGKAIGAIDKAREVHAARRQKVAGFGVNPLTDPSEQAFLRACDELKSYWTLKQQIYDDPTGQAVARANGPRGVLTALLSAKKQLDAGGTASAAELAQAKQQAATLSKELGDAKTARDEQTVAARRAKDEADKRAADLAAAAKERDAKAKDAEAAKAELTAAGKKLAAAEQAVAAVVAKLKEAKLIDPAADAAAALAALPEAAKKAVVVSGADKAVADLTAALTAAKDARAAAEKKAAEADAALAAATREARAADDRAAAALAAEAKRHEAQLAAQAEAFRAQLTAARSGAVVPITDAERVAADRAAKFYAAGRQEYAAGRWADAERLFASATTDDPSDARYWYFLGLSKWAQGKPSDADFKTGSGWESRSRLSRKAVGEALVNVQGEARAAVEAARP